MFKLTYKKRVWIVKQYKGGIPPSKIAMAQKVSQRTVYNIVNTYKEYGWDGLKDHKTGRPFEPLNPKTYNLIVRKRKETGYGACKLEEYLRQRGFSISHKKIHHVLLQESLAKPNLNKQKPRRYVRYELPNSNDLWHTDWMYCPFTQKQLSAYLDDHSRYTVSYGLFNKALADYSIILLKSGIAEHGKPKTVMTDHGSQFYANKTDNRGFSQSRFQLHLQKLGIKHYVARVNRPQTNGKIERWFQCYKEEYIKGSYSSLKDFIKWYNEERIHMSLRYRTPKEIYEEGKCEVVS